MEMVLILSTSEVLLSFEEYLVDNYEEVVYCLNENLYKRLLKENILVEMAYMKGGCIYTPLSDKYEGPIVINEDSFEYNLKRYNINVNGWEEDINSFISKYPNITTQERILYEEG